MGCDIHVMLEYRAPGDITQHWDSLAWHAINPGRNYEKFNDLAGVRGYGGKFSPRGLPSDPSWATENEYWMFVSETPGNGEHYVKPEDAARWVLQGISKWRNDKHEWVSDPDAHTHSWLTYDEWVEALGDMPAHKGDADWRALTAAAASYVADGHEVRFLFWFDN